MSEPAVIAAVRAFKMQLERQSAGEMATMAGRWARLEDRLQQYINNLLKELADKRAAGIVIGEPMQLERYRELLHQTRVEIAKYTTWAQGRIASEQAAMVKAGVAQAAELIEAARVTGYFNRLNTRAIETMTAMVQEQAPLAKLLNAVWPKSALSMSQALEDGIALGWGPRQTAKAMMTGLEDGLQRAMTIARTEQLRAYRVATNEQYIQSGVVNGWMWVCAKNANVCAACLAMDGTEHPLSEEQGDHPNGGCTSVPIVLGEKPEWQTGDEWFKTLSEAEQRTILGDAKYEAWDGGKGFEFSQLAQTAHSETWGDSVRVATLGELESKQTVVNVMGYTWNRETYQTVADARLAGEADDGWRKYEQVFRDEYLPKYELYDDIERTLGLWSGPEPSFNAYLRGQEEQMMELARAWGRDYQQDAVALLLPKEGAEGGKLIWDFGRTLSDSELDALLKGVGEVNSTLGHDLASAAGIDDFPIGLTVKGSSCVEFWVADRAQGMVGSALIDRAISMAGFDVPEMRQQLGYEFRLVFK